MSLHRGQSPYQLTIDSEKKGVYLLNVIKKNIYIYIYIY